jgi:hypothetical protein
MSFTNTLNEHIITSNTLIHLHDNINSFILLEVQSNNTARVQECHQIIYHYFCEYIDNVIIDEGYNYGNGG